MGDGDLKTSEVDLVNEKIEENGLAKSPQPSASPPPATVMAPSSGVRAPRGGGGERKQLAQHAVFLPDHFKTFVVDSTKAFDRHNCFLIKAQFNFNDCENIKLMEYLYVPLVFRLQFNAGVFFN